MYKSEIIESEDDDEDLDEEKDEMDDDDEDLDEEKDEMDDDEDEVSESSHSDDDDDEDLDEMFGLNNIWLLYTSPSPRDRHKQRIPFLACNKNQTVHRYTAHTTT